MSYNSESDEEFAIYPEENHHVSKCALPFDRTKIEDVILAISDRFDFRVVMSDTRAKGAVLMTAGLTIAGGLIGRHYGGKVGAMVGGAVGGACGVGCVIMTMRSIWNDIKDQLYGVIDIVYDYLGGLGIKDYTKAFMFLTQNGCSAQLGMIILQSVSSILGKKILSSLMAPA